MTTDTPAKQPRQRSDGACALCGAVLPKTRMTEHLKACVAEHEAEAQASKPKAQPVNLFHILVEGHDVRDYWLHLDIPVTTRLRTLDEFLRGIWLECCGHLSQFIIDNICYISYDDPFERDRDTLSMNHRLADVLEPGMRFKHEYDFGTTTFLDLRVLGQYSGLNRRPAVRLLARNNPPDRPCAVCGKPAAVVCSMCIYTDTPAWYCQEHQEQHPCPDGYDEAYFLPVANSPRVGMCGYAGSLE